MGFAYLGASFYTLPSPPFPSSSDLLAYLLLLVRPMKIIIIYQKVNNRRDYVLILRIVLAHRGSIIIKMSDRNNLLD